MKIFFKKIKIFILFGLLFFPAISFSADLSISLPAEVKLGNNFEALVNINSDGILINSAELTIDFDENLVSFSGYKTDGAVIDIWLEAPSEKKGKVYLSGIIPGGVAGLYDLDSNNRQVLGPTPLVRLLFTARREGNAEFSFNETKILKHDGSGTELSHIKNSNMVSIKSEIKEDEKEAGGSVQNDLEKPEPFEITYINASAFSRTPSLIMFSANDTGSGIKEYKMNIGGSLWVNVQSPREISKGIFSKTITIRAYDFAGNFQDSKIQIDGIVSPAVLIIVLILLTILCFMGYKMIKYKRNET